MAKTSAANEAVIRIREIKSALKAAKEKSDSSKDTKVLEAFTAELSSIEEELYQVKNQSGQDPLNFPIKLNNRLASLRRSVEDGDARPTDGAYKVFKELSAELDIQLNALKKSIDSYQSKVNPILTENGVSTIE